MTKHTADKKRIFLKFTTFLCAIAFVMLISEAILRILDYPAKRLSPWISCRETGFKFAPNLERRMVALEYDIIFKTNSLGLRDDEITPKNGYRILLLGDSLTCGYGVKREEQFADLLEDRLNVDIINAGVGGFEISHQLRYYKTQGKQFDPDLVVYALYLGNDLTGNPESDFKKKVLFNNKREFLLSVLPEIKLLILYINFRDTLINRVIDARRGSYKKGGYREWKPYPVYLAMCAKELSPASRKNYAVSKKLIRQLRDEVISSGADFLVVMFSYRTVIEEDAALRLKSEIPDFDTLYDLNKPAQMMESFLSNIGVEYICLNNPMKEYYKSSNTPLFYFSDGHFTESGHQFVANTLYPILKQKIDIFSGKKE